MIITDGKKVMTLQELATRICNSYDDKSCDECPAKDYCEAGHNGMLDWLRKVIANEQD